MKKLITFFLALAVALAFTSCSNDGLKEQRLRFNFDNAEYLLIDNGEPEKAIRIADKDVLQTYSEEFNSHKYVKTAKSLNDNYYYRIEWYDGDNQKTETIFIMEENGYKIRHNGDDYKVGADLNIDKELYQNLFE